MILHQTWKTHDVPASMDYRESWRRHSPGLEMDLWDDHACRSLVAMEESGLLSTYDSLPHPIMRCDMWRYIVLYHLGGIYADLDVECLGPMDALSSPGVHLIEEMLHPGFTVGPYLMASSEPGHPFWKHVLGILCQRADRRHIKQFTDLTKERQHEAILSTTGPYMLTEAYRLWPEQGQLYVHTEASLGVKHHAVGSWWRK